VYKIGHGTVDDDHYGLRLARSMEFPPEFMEYAEQAIRELDEIRKANAMSKEEACVRNTKMLVMNLYRTLQSLPSSSLSGQVLVDYLVNLQKEFITKLAALETDGGGLGLTSPEERDDGGNQGTSLADALTSEEVSTSGEGLSLR
jgi:DNA mismatch repair protein MSH4